jgi:hypothetical protein
MSERYDHLCRHRLRVCEGLAKYDKEPTIVASEPGEDKAMQEVVGRQEMVVMVIAVG